MPMIDKQVESKAKMFVNARALEKEAVLFSMKTGTENITNLRLIIESVTRTAEYASDIAEIVLNLTVESIIG